MENLIKIINNETLIDVRVIHKLLNIGGPCLKWMSAVGKYSFDKIVVIGKNRYIYPLNAIKLLLQNPCHINSIKMFEYLIDNLDIELDEQCMSYISSYQYFHSLYIGYSDLNDKKVFKHNRLRNQSYLLFRFIVILYIYRILN